MPVQTYTISELAREFDLTTRAIRFYEDLGLIAPERVGQQRIYSARDRTRLALTLRAKRLGLSLTEARSILDIYESPRDTVPQLEEFLRVLGEHRAQLESQLVDLQANLDDIRTQETQARAILARVRRTSAAPAPSVHSVASAKRTPPRPRAGGRGARSAS